MKVQSKNSWEVQIATTTGEILQVAYRRSDFIEDLHDGSYFFGAAKIWIYLPVAILLLGLWCTGLFLFILPYWVKWRRALRARRA